jgi:hypothetical protein
MKNLLLLLTLFSCLKTFAQTSSKITVKGIVTDSANNQPLGYATITLLEIKTKKAISSTLSKDDGSFEVSAAADKQCQISLAYIGYQTKIFPIPDAGSKTDLGKISL